MRPTPLAALAAVFWVLGCESGKPSGDRANPAPTASASSSVSTPAGDPPRHKLADRSAVDTGAIAKARSDVLEALNKARALAAQKKPEEAHDALAEAWPLDPMGAVLALEASRQALATGDKKSASHHAQSALAAAKGHEQIEKKALDALEKATGPTSGPTSSGPFDTIDQACKHIVGTVRSGAVELPSREASSDLRCKAEYSVKLGAKELEGATSIRVESKGKVGTDVLAWVAVQTPKGLLLAGPVERLFAPALYGLTNDFTLDLQHVDALPGGSPEIVVRIDERRTAVDVALNEQLELDVAHVVLLTTDRGKLEHSKQLMLSERLLRSLVDPKDKRLPAGFAHSKLLGKGSEYQMKVAWSGPNTITLTRFLGNAAPPAQGAITLFE